MLVNNQLVLEKEFRTAMASLMGRAQGCILSPGRGCCVILLVELLYSDSASLPAISHGTHVTHVYPCSYMT